MQAQELLEMLGSRQDRLPQQEIDVGIPSQCSGCQKGTCAQAPQPCGTTVDDLCEFVADIVGPIGPGRVAEIAATVATAAKVALHDTPTVASKQTRHPRRHAARLVHLFGEAVDKDDSAPYFAIRRLRYQAKPETRAAFDEFG